MTEEMQASTALMCRVAQGDEEALSDFYDSTVARCYGLAFRIVGDHAAAEDVVAETYLKVWRDARKFDSSRGNAITWLLTICRSRAIDQLRQREQAEPIGLPTEGASLDLETDRKDDPCELLSAIQTSHKLSDAMQQLAEIPRQILTMAFFKGLTHQEISDQTDLPLGTIKSHIRRAQGVLRSALGERGSL